MFRHPASTNPPGLASQALQLLQRIQHGTSSVELIYATHAHWPFRPGQSIHTLPTLRISVLDSSFNPPTLAHLALANSLPPPSSRPGAPPAEPYDARMLLLSVRNADKVLKPGDATFVQRLEMMCLLSRDIHTIESAQSCSNSVSPQTCGNVAVAIIDEPTFVGKSALLLRFLQERLATVLESTHSYNRKSDKQDASCLLPSPKLTFLMGFDTFVRLLSPRYYPSEQAMLHKLQAFLSPDQEDCRIVCAYRGNVSADRTLEVAREFITSDRISFIGIGAEEETYSSSEVRTRVAAAQLAWRRLVTNAIADYIIERRMYSYCGREQ